MKNTKNIAKIYLKRIKYLLESIAETNQKYCILIPNIRIGIALGSHISLPVDAITHNNKPLHHRGY